MLANPLTLARGCLGLLLVAALLGVPPTSAQVAGTPAEPFNIPNGALSKYLGETVSDVRFQGIQGTNPEMLRGLMAQKTNEPLDREKLSASLKTLYATGRFSKLEVMADQAGSGSVVLTYIAQENYFYGAVRVEGLNEKTPPRANEMVNASRLDLGDTFSEERVRDAIDRLKKVMSDNGYYTSSVTYSLAPQDDTRQMQITFHVVPGELARVGQVRIRGDSGIPQEKVIGITKLKPGKKVSADHLSRALDRLRQHYQGNDHLEAQVSLTAREYRAESNSLDYVFSVEEGSKIVIIAEGDKISRRQLHKLVPVFQENAVDQDLLNEGRRNVRNYLQTKGYFDASVDVIRHEDPAKDLVTITYDIDAGEKHKLAAVAIEGNRYFDRATIRERLSIMPATWIVQNGMFSQKMLANDVDSIKSLYINNGFQQVKVDAGLTQDYAEHKGDIAVLFKITEGPQTLVNDLTLAGNKDVDSAVLKSLLICLPGQPYSEADLISDRDALTLYYYNHGYPDVSFESSVAPVTDNPQRLNVTYIISEGQKVGVDRVLMTGLDHTRPYIVDRAMRIRSGDPLNQAAMVDSQRRLYNLGIFNQVSMAVQNPDGVEPQKDILFDLTEAKRWTFRYGGGIEIATGNIPSTSNPQGTTGVSPNGVLEITRLNMFGKDQTLTMRGRLGLLTRRALISYDAPRLWRRENWRFTVSAFYDNTADVNTFASERLEGSVQAEQRYSRSTTFLYRMTFQRVRVDPNSLVIDPNLIPLYSQPVRIAMPSFSMIRDKRDNPIDSHRGNYTTLDVGIATSALGSQSNFTRMLFDNSTYYTIKKRWVLARRTQLGIERPYGTNHYGNGSPETAIPLPELFFAGGSNSQRGFSINQAGPRDPVSGYALGGQALFINNLELRTPPVPLPLVGNNLGFVIFHDMGNVFAQVSDMWSGIVRLHQPSIAACSPPTSELPCNFSYNPQAIGTGVRYNTPIGPVRLDLGYTFNPTRYPVREQDIQTSLRHFNFFFSIGQTF